MYNNARFHICTIRFTYLHLKCLQRVTLDVIYISGFRFHFSLSLLTSKGQVLVLGITTAANYFDISKAIKNQQ